MPSINETAYPRFKSSLSENNLENTYLPSNKEIIFASEITRKPKYKLFLLILLKAYQRLGYFTSMNHIPNEIKSYISNVMGIQYEEDQIEKYSKSRMKFNHMDSIRKFLDIKPYGKESRKVIIQAATEAAKIKDNDADIINIVIEELIKQKYELPAFSTLVRVSRRIRYTTYNSYYRNIYKSLNSNTIESIDSLLSEKNDTYTSWNNIKQDVGKPSVKNIKVVISYLNLLKTIKIDTNILTKVPDIKIKHFVNEAKSLDSSKMKELKASKRYTLAICFLKQRLASTLDDIGEIFIKLIKNAQNKSRDKLAKYKLEQSKTTDNLISTLKSFIITYKIEETDDKKINALMQLMENKNLDDLLEKCETHEKYSDNNYWPFLWNSLKGKRSVLFHILNEIQLCSTTQNNSIENAIKFIKKYKNANRLDTISTTDKEIGRLDLSWVKEPWWRILTGYTNRNKYPEKINRRHFEACVMYQIMHDLKSGDLCIKNSDIYSDYRDQLISWEEYNNNIDTFANQVGLPVLENEFIQHLKDNMEKAIFDADNSFPENQYLKIKNGVPILSKIRKKDEPKDLKVIQNLIAEDLETVNILDILSDTEKWIQWTNQFGSISGFDSKIKDKIEKYLMTTFCYGCNLGPSQTSKSLQEISRKQLSWINKRHVTEEKLEKTIKNLINAYNLFPLPKYWGTGKRSAADGTKWDMYEQNLLSEYHIRYGGYGGIGYYHVSDLYIALFSRFIPCGVWEGVYILDEFIKNDSNIQPNIVHADTQGQNTTIFGLSFLLGIDLMPRIRNWKKLDLCKPDKSIKCKHIDEIFSDYIDFDIIKTYLPDMLRIVLSIKMGRIAPSTILKKLGSYSRQNKLYQAFKELGRAIRTIFLLKYISDIDLRTTIQEATNKNESFNGFIKWLFFGGEGIIAENNRDEQRKIIKYNHLVANCVIFYNVYHMSKILQELIIKGYKIDGNILSSLSPYITSHINRFGEYKINKNRNTPSLNYDIDIFKSTE